MAIDKELASKIEHTALKAGVSVNDVKWLCKEAMNYNFAVVVVPPAYVSLAKETLEKHPHTRLCTVVGFPFGYTTTAAKVFEAQQALEQGATEIDMVVNVGDVLEERWNSVENEIYHLTQLCHHQGAILKVIIESGMLNEAQIIQLCEIAARVQVDYVKTSTGFASKGADVPTIELLRRNLPASIKIKASGGIKTREFAIELLKAGADTLGSSSSVKIVDSL
ncbi:MAG: deoxyribose-phosphate aldolase [Sphingobacteriales bacterium]|nr:deoxyribose-phosphate aldolase [Sphingobacteriales bacterium]